MSINALGPLRAIAARLRRREPTGALVLLYHRVQAVESDPWSLAVSPSRFAAHLEVLRRHARPMPLQTLVRCVRAGVRVPRGVAITFDDGYADNLSHALPLLERHRVPASVFLVSACLGQQRGFWWDELEQLLLRPGRLPRTLQLALDGHLRTWDLGDQATYTPQDFGRHRSWRAGGDEGPTPRHRAFAQLHRLLGAAAEAERRQLMDQLVQLAGRPPPAACDGGRPLTRAEAVALDRSGWVEIGVHTRTHPMLDRLSPAQQREEIRGAKIELEALLQRPLLSFAYPYGRHAADTPALVEEAGFACACTVEPGDVRADSDPFRLNRMVVGDWSGEVFAQRLGRWMAGA